MGVVGSRSCEHGGNGMLRSASDCPECVEGGVSDVFTLILQSGCELGRQCVVPSSPIKGIRSTACMRSASVPKSKSRVMLRNSSAGDRGGAPNLGLGGEPAYGF